MTDLYALASAVLAILAFGYYLVWGLNRIAKSRGVWNLVNRNHLLPRAMARYRPSNG